LLTGLRFGADFCGLHLSGELFAALITHAEALAGRRRQIRFLSLRRRW
jgi:hypothetical protein